MSQKIGYIVGSLSKESINRRLAKALARLAPEGVELVDIPIGDLPLYNRDLDGDYPPEAVMLVQYIRTAQQLGFTLAEIGDRLPGIWDAPDPAPAIAGVLAVKLQEIDARIAALQALRETLAERVAAACPLLAAPEKI